MQDDTEAEYKNEVKEFEQLQSSLENLTPLTLGSQLRYVFDAM